MRIKTFGRHIREGVKNLLRNGWMTFASISSVTITLLILGLSLVIAFNANQMSKYVSDQLEINVFLNLNVSDSQGATIADEVRKLPGVQTVQVITKEQGMKSLSQQIGSQYNDVVAGLSGTENPLPVQLVVKAKDPTQQLTVSSEIKAVPGVYQIHDGKAYVDRLLNFLSIMRDVGIAFVLALVVTAMFLISNTIKITIFSRRREIEIMRLVGATNWFIRWPFLLEGMIIGGVGALIPLVTVTLGYNALFSHQDGIMQAFSFPLLQPSQLASTLAVIMLGIGLFIGTWGGIMSIRKFLKI